MRSPRSSAISESLSASPPGSIATAVPLSSLTREQWACKGPTGTQRIFICYNLTPLLGNSQPPIVAEADVNNWLDLKANGASLDRHRRPCLCDEVVAARSPCSLSPEPQRQTGSSQRCLRLSEPVPPQYSLHIR